MKSLIANTAREMGFDDQQIRRAIERLVIYLTVDSSNNYCLLAKHDAKY